MNRGEKMIKNNLSKILGERLLSISKVSQDTGIARSTLTGIYYRKSKGIQYDTLNTLCEYLGCGVSEILEHITDN
ncbi:helix-turn-helix domain-containing protein [Peptostreptococcus sp.]|uniref:helix-turn-helix domain-containing protein n=1 Tax=Peptostreptococcus sp. TaxID=1262 RepID=UPI003FA7BED6